jgi:hypothetical protein
MRPSQIFLYSDREFEGERAAPRPDGSTMGGGIFKRHKMLSVEQMLALEEFVMRHNLPMVRSKIKWAAQKLRIPYQRSVEHLFSKYKREEPGILRFYERCMDELRMEREDIDRTWRAYLHERERYTQRGA